jgi:hypothetical protein
MSLAKSSEQRAPLVNGKSICNQGQLSMTSFGDFGNSLSQLKYL